MPHRVPATRTNLIRLKKTLAIAEEGHALLDEKRRILIAEFTRVLEEARRAQERTDLLLAEAYDLTVRAEVSVGEMGLASLASAIAPQAEISVSHTRVMGVSIPAVTVTVAEREPQWSPFDAPLVVDEAAAKWRDVLEALAVLAEKKTALLRLGREIQKTMRKVNALEKIHLPYYRGAIKEIGERLDEESREAFTLLKQIKDRRERRQGDVR